MSTNTAQQKGFALPAILLVSTILLIVGMAMMQSISSIRTSLEDQYYNRITKQAAEAGITAANFCLRSNDFTQTWGPSLSRPALTQSRTCTGSNRTPAITSLVNSGNIRSTFEVNNLEIREDGAIIIASVGKVELMQGTTATRTYTMTLKQLVEWKTFKASLSVSGKSRTCSIISNEVYCWGLNNYGQLGNNSYITSYPAVKVYQESGVLSGKIVSDLFTAKDHTCALAEGKVYCWGLNDSGQIGNGSTNGTTGIPKPSLVAGALSGKIVTDIGGAGDTSCAIAEGKIYCWGLNSKGTIGNNSTTNYSEPQAVSTLELPSTYTATALSTSGSMSQTMCAIVNGKAWCWGGNEAGQIGLGTTGGSVLWPRKVDDTGQLSGKTVTSISQDGYSDGTDGTYPHVCVVANNDVYCWGENSVGQLGRGNTSDSNVPVRTVGALSSKVVQEVAVGISHSCVVANSRAYCWGGNNYGQLGNDNVPNGHSNPTLVSELAGGLQGKTVTGVGGGADRGCAIADFKSYCWGLNTDGQIGDGTLINRAIPTEATFLRPQVPSFIF